MRKFSLLVALLFTLAGFLSAQTSGTLQIGGVVTNKINVTFSVSDVSLVNLRLSRSMELGTINLGGNEDNGFSVTITSQNGGVLRGSASENAEVLPYTLSFGDYAGIDLSTGFQLVFNPKSTENFNYPLSVQFPDFEALDSNVASGEYEDILTITVSVN